MNIFQRSGFYCESKNNHDDQKECKDYKVRFCCVPERPAYWAEWTKWTKCSKSCDGGEMKRTRKEDLGK